MFKLALGFEAKPSAALGVTLVSVVTSTLLTTILMVALSGPRGFGAGRDGMAESSGISRGGGDNQASRIVPPAAAAEAENPMANCVDVVTPFHEDDALLFVNNGALESMKRRLIGVRRIYVVSRHKVHTPAAGQACFLVTLASKSRESWHCAK